MNNAVAHTPVNAETIDLISQFIELEASDPRAFTQQIADNVMEPVRAETMALRSPELVNKTMVAVRSLLEETSTAHRKVRKGSEEERRRNFFLAQVSRERRMLEVVISGLRAQGFNLPPAENPRKRAMVRLANENLRGDVPRGRFRDLLNEEQEITRERKRAAKKERAELRNAELAAPR